MDMTTDITSRQCETTEREFYRQNLETIYHVKNHNSIAQPHVLTRNLANKPISMLIPGDYSKPSSQ